MIRRLQYRLRTLLLVMTGIAALFFVGRAS